ncbi:MAG: LuxR C-terminal-related transcriptional regulator [Akkermansiaceae bacterium]
MQNSLTNLTNEESLKLHDLWRIAADATYSNSSETLKLFTQRLACLFNAKKASWIAVIHGKSPSDVYSIQLLAGWWALDIVDYDPNFDVDEITSKFIELTRKHGTGRDTKAMLKASGQTRVQLRQDTISDEDFDDHWKTKYYNVPILGIKERMHTAYHVSPVAESYFLIDRDVDGAPFTERDRGLAYLAISGAAVLHRKLFIERGLVAPASHPLSPREKEIFPHLFTDLTQKEIASKLGISMNTVSKNINIIYQKFKVRGRNGLISVCQ